MTTPWAPPVRAYMSRGLVSVRPTTSLADVQRIFEEREISAVPVMDGASLVGIVTSTDLLREARLELIPPGSVMRVTPPPHTAADLMRRDVLTISDGAPILDAVKVMLARHVHRLVVIREGTPVAVVSVRDAMRAVFDERIPTPLRAVMTTPVVAIEMGETVDAAIAQLDDANVHGLVVVDEGWPIGVFTHTEAIRSRALAPSLRQMPVERVMSYETICLDVTTPLYRVAAYSIQMRARRILAVDKRDLVGVVTGFDLLRVLEAWVRPQA